MCGLDEVFIDDSQAVVRQRILRAFVQRGLIEKDDADEKGGCKHGGRFSVDASVCIEGTDRPGLERLLRYCARPAFALEHLQQRNAEHLVYRNPKPRPDGPSELVLTPLELIDMVAITVPPPRAHRRYYYGVLAPNVSLREDVSTRQTATLRASDCICGGTWRALLQIRRMPAQNRRLTAAPRRQ
jgi:hypothetical protein